MATFNASSTSVNIALQDGFFSYWIQAGSLANPNLAETPVTTGTTFIESDPGGFGVQAVWGGSGFTYAAPAFLVGGTVLRSEVTGGTATSLTFADLQNNTVYTLTNFNLALTATPRPTLADIFSGNDDITSGAGNDTLDGGAGNDDISSGAGDDSILGGVGEDTIAGGTGTDIVNYNLDFTGGLLLSINTRGIGTGAITGVTDNLNGIENIIGTNLNDTISGGTDTLNGASANNWFDGKAGNDNMGGGSGNDTLAGGSGTDSLAGGGGTDFISFADEFIQVIIDLTATTHTVGGVTENHATFENVIGSATNDSIMGSGAGNDLRGGAGNDTMAGAGGNDTLIGGTGVDSLSGGIGADRLDGSADGYQFAADTLVGGANDDYYLIESAYYSSSPFDVVVEANNEGTDTVEIVAIYGSTYTGYVLAENVENLIVGNLYYYSSATAAGNNLDNVITGKTSAYSVYSYNYGNFKLYGAGGNDTITGGHGNDTLNGGVGADLMVGGRGNDIYYVNVAGDVVQEQRASFGVDKIVTTISLTLDANIEDGTLLGVLSAQDLTGNGNANTLRGNQFDNMLTGLDGSDYLFGGAGADTLLGGSGNDLLNGGMGADVLDGGDGIDTADFTNLGVAITVNLATAGAQNTGAGSDTLTSIEQVYGGSQDDSIRGAADANNLLGYAGNDTLVGLGGNDALYGGAGDDLLQGGTEFDYLYGDAGNDRLFGGAGTDVLYGSTGADVFNFDVKDLYDTVSDFVSGEDKMAFDMSQFDIGNGNLVVNNGVSHFGTGGFAANAELVIFTQGYSEFAVPTVFTAAAAAIGDAASAYAAGDTRLFAIDNGTNTHLYLFTSAAADNTVTAAELQLVGVLFNSPETVLSDYMFVA